jgi:hypothetical protein
MKKAIVFLSMVLFPFAGWGQSLSPTVIASAGDYFDNGTVSISFTVGEVAVTTLEAGDVILTQGFQQPFELDVTGVKDQEISWSVRTYPNPVKENLHVKFTLESPEGFTLVVMDLTGKKVFIKKYDQVQPGEVKDIDFQNYAPGIYLVSVTSNDKSVRKIYKVQKVK